MCGLIDKNFFQFNEWHEGTQIEPAIPKTVGRYTYSSYEPEKPDAYLVRTREWTEKFANPNQLDTL